MSVTLLAPPGMPSIPKRITFADLNTKGAATTTTYPMTPVGLPAGAIFLQAVVTLSTRFDNPGHDQLDLYVKSSAAIEYGDPVDQANASAGTYVAVVPASGFGGDVAGKTPTLFFDANGGAMSSFTVGDVTVNYVYMVPP